jgi:hypothetical protein
MMVRQSPDDYALHLRGICEMNSCEACRQFEASDPHQASVESLLGRLSVAVRTRRLLFVDVNWDGCSGCSNLELGQAMFSECVQLNSIFASVSWKDDANPTKPTHKEFTLFTEMVRGHRQHFGADLLVESYPVPPWDRPHFPQLFFLDPRRVDESSLRELCRLYTTGVLFTQDNDLNLADTQVRLAVYRTFQQGAVLIQLLNEHLFAVPNDQFQEPEFFATFDCVVNQFRALPSDPESCFRYERPKEHPRGEY